MPFWKQKPDDESDERYQRLVERAGHLHGYQFGIMLGNPNDVRKHMTDDDVMNAAYLSNKALGPGLTDLYSDEFEEGYSRGFYGSIEDQENEQNGTTWMPGHDPL